MVYARGMIDQAGETRRQASVLKRQRCLLLSDQAGYITGQVLVVDGGATLVGPEPSVAVCWTEGISRATRP
jgi:enoyl-[acyl-carrier-protein] reductase (NADH)